MSGWNGSDRRERLPANWNDLVKQVWRRDGGRCTWVLPKSKKRCPRPGRDVDHRRNDDDHSLSNLQLLCGHHHDKKTQWEARRAKSARRAIGRPQEAHPGVRRP